MQTERLPYGAAKKLIRAGDLLLWRGSRRSPLDWAVMAAGRSPYVHAGMAEEGQWTVGSGQWGVLEMQWGVLEMLQFHGGRFSSLEAQVRHWPGRWDLYHTNPADQRPEFARRTAVYEMRRVVGARYGWFNVLRTGLRHLPVVRLLVPPLTDDAVRSGRPPFCSEAVAYAYRRGGVDPVPNLADRVTEPGDLARSPFFVYVCTMG